MRSTLPSGVTSTAPSRRPGPPSTWSALARRRPSSQALWDRNRGEDWKEALELCLTLVQSNSAERLDEALEMAVTGLVNTGRYGEVIPLLNAVSPERLSSLQRDAFL